MSGIGRIQSLREESRQEAASRSAVPFREVWFRDGDQAFVTSIATGEDNDVNLDEISLYTFRQGNRFVNLLNDDGVDLSSVPTESRPSRKFAFWGYVHEIIHAERRNDDWEELQGPGGKKMFKESVNDFRIICLGFGRNDYLWNQLVDVYNDWNSLNKGVLRIKRTGAGMRDTSYAIAATARDSEIPDDKQDEVADLPPIKEYYKERYGALWVPGPSSDNEELEIKVEADSLELF